MNFYFLRSIDDLKNCSVETDNLYVTIGTNDVGIKRAFIVSKRALTSLAQKYDSKNVAIRKSAIDLTHKDIHALIQAIVDCEVDKYKDQVDDPREMFDDFLHDCVYESDFSKLDKHYEITDKGKKANLKEHSSPWEQFRRWIVTKAPIHPRRDI